MSEEKKNLEQKTDNLETTQETDNKLNLEELDNVAGGKLLDLSGDLPEILQQELDPKYKRKLGVLDE